MQSVKLYISCASNRDWKGRFGSSLASLISHLTAHINSHETWVDGFKLDNFFWRALGQSSCLSIARQRMVDEMIAGDYTHYLALDDDMTFPVDIVDRLIAHNLDAVAINARHKCKDVKGSLVGLDGKHLDSTAKAGLEEIQTMGGAIFLAKIDAFRHIPKPHFQVLWSPHHNDYVSEDIHFAALLRANGVRLFCDHTVSQEVTHIGEFEYGWPQLIAKPKLEIIEAA